MIEIQTIFFPQFFIGVASHKNVYYMRNQQITLYGFDIGLIFLVIKIKI